MMKIAIHGTKGGYHIISGEPLAELFDARPDTSRVAAIGRQAYSIHFSSVNCIFSKYKIIRDVIGDKRTGNIAFSIVIPRKQKLSGSNVKRLLDRLFNEYCEKYIVDDNLENVREDWKFVNEALNDYERQLNFVSLDDGENVQSGTKDAAFVYYITDDELERYLDSPDQEEYFDFRQIFFVKNELQGQPENPLNALRHDSAYNLTGKIDLENPKYKLLFNEYARGGVKIELKVNNSKRSNKSKIKRKNELEIIYSKPFYKTKSIPGKWYEISEEFVDVNDSARTVTIKEVELVPEPFDVMLDVKDRRGNHIFDPEITYHNNYQQERKIIGTKITFSGEERKEKWTIIAKKDNLISQPIFIIPDRQNGVVLLVLSERKEIKIEISNEDKLNIYNCTIQISGLTKQPKDDILQFVGDEIDKDWGISISHRDYYGDRFYYCPANGENPIKRTLRKKTEEKQNKYFIDAGQYGENISGKFSVNSVNEVKKEWIKPKKGYHIIEFKLDKTQFNYYDGTIIPIYEKEKISIRKLIFLTIGIIGFISGLLLIYYILFGPGLSEKKTDSPELITKYVKGVELNIDKLNKFKTDYCNNSDVSQEGTKTSWWQQLLGFGEESKTVSTTTSDYCSGVINALAIRNAIIEGKIDTLITLQYDSIQSSFQMAVENIDERFKSKIGKIMNLYGPLDTMNLNSISIFINNLQKLLQIRNDLNTLSNGEDLARKKEEVAHINCFVDSIKKNIKTEIESRIEEKLSKPKEVKKTEEVITRHPSGGNAKNNDPIKSTGSQSSKLESDFFKLIHECNTQKDAYTKLLNNHRKESGEIVNYLHKICENMITFDEFKESLMKLSLTECRNITTITALTKKLK